MSTWTLLAVTLVGSFLAFGAQTNNEILTGQREDGAIKLNIRLEGSLQNPAFSPDGNKIVFTRFRDGYNLGPSDLFVFDLQKGTLRKLVSEGSSNANLPGSSWDATRKTIIFSSDRGEHDEIYTIAASGQPGDEMQLTNRAELQSFEPSFSPFGRWVVFESRGVDQEEGMITKYWHDGGRDYIDLSAPGEVIKQPNWSPKGDKILFQKLQNDNWAIWTMDVDGGEKEQVTPLQWSSTDAVFSKDGAVIIFSAENENVAIANIFAVARSGEVPVALTRFEGYDGAPSIADDGNWLVFESSLNDPDGSSGTSLWKRNLSHALSE